MVGSVSIPNNVVARVIDRVISFFHFMAILAIAAIAILLIYDVAMRFVFNKPVEWVLDVVQLAQVTLAFVAAAPILREGGHINMEILKMMVSKRTDRKLAILSNGICTAGSLWMTVLGWRTFRQSYLIGESSYGITLPLYPWKFLVPLCFFILSLQFFAMFLSQIKNRE